MSQFPFIFLFIFLLFNIAFVQAQTHDLYEGRVPIEKYHDPHSQENFKQAFTQVLIKLSGDAKKPRQTLIQANLGDIAYLVEDYTYQILSEGSQRVFVVHFDKTQTNEMLLKLGLPHWPHYVSPSLLGWIGLEEDFLTEETSSKEVELLRNQALQRGITLFFPLFDIEDITLLKPSALNSGIKAPVAKIIQRYGIPTVLVAWIFKTLNQWQSQWHLYIEDKEIIFNHAHLQRSLLLTEAINQAIDEIAQHFSKPAVPHVTLPEEEFEFLVIDLPSLQEYTQINAYLKKLPIVTDIQVLSIQREQAKFRVSVEGGKKAFLQAISLGTLLVPHKGDDMVFHFKKLNRVLE